MILGYQRTSFSVFPIQAAFYSFRMFVIARRFFATEAAAGLQQKAAESTTELQKLFSNQCATIMKVRGHHKLQMDTVVSKRGKQMKFDFTYGWPFRYYCVCDLGTETVTKEAMLKFEKSLKEVGVNPNHGVYFSKASYEGNPEELHVLFVDPKLLSKMEEEKNSRAIRQNKVIFFCVIAMLYLSWTFFSEMNPQRRRLIERWHRYVLKDNKTHDEIFDKKSAKESSAASAAPAAPAVPATQSMAAPRAHVTESVINSSEESIMSKEPIVVLPAEETKMEEDKEVPEQNSGIWSYLTSTFWWMLGYKN